MRFAGQDIVVARQVGRGLAVVMLLLALARPVIALQQATPSLAQVPAGQETGAWLAERLPDALAEYGVPGAALALVTSDQVLTLAGAGSTALDGGQPIDAARTAFRAPALGRVIAAFAALQLENQGKLDLLAPINNLPAEIELPGTNGIPLSLAHLLTSSSGYSQPTARLMLDSVEDVPLLAEALASLPRPRSLTPEAVLSESSYATALAALVIEQAAGVPYSDYIEANILYPLGLGVASVAQPLPRHVVEVVAAGHTNRSGKARELPSSYLLLPAADGVYLSASAGAVLLKTLLNDGAHGNERVIEPGQLALLLEPQFRLADGLPGVTLAFDELWLGNDHLLELTASRDGYSSAVLLWPAEKLGFILLYNSDDPALYHALRNELFEKLGVGLARDILPASRLSAAYAEQVKGYYGRLPRASGRARASLLLAGDASVEMVLDVTREGFLSIASAKEVAWSQLAPGLFGDSLQRHWLYLLQPDGAEVKTVYLNQASYERVPWSESLYWQRRLGILLLVLLFVLGLAPLVISLVQRRGRASLSLLLSVIMAVISLALSACSLIWYLAFNAQLTPGQSVASMTAYLPWAAGVAMLGVVVLLAIGWRGKRYPLWLGASALAEVLVAAGALWYAYAWYLI